MEAKLRELTDKIYEEGVERARKEAEALLAEARKQADHLLSEAQRDANHARAKAQEEAEELRHNLQSELQLSAQQALSGLKQEVSQLVLARLLNEPLREAFNDREFLQRIIETAIKSWSANDGQGGLVLLLPEKERAALDARFEGSLRALLQESLEIDLDGRLSQGFRIGPADRSYVISFTPEDFERFFRLYLRPLATRILYEEKTKQA